MSELTKFKTERDYMFFFAGIVCGLLLGAIIAFGFFINYVVSK